MSKKSSKISQPKQASRLQPAILRRKRKAECEAVLNVEEPEFNPSNKEEENPELEEAELELSCNPDLLDTEYYESSPLENITPEPSETGFAFGSPEHCSGGDKTLSQFRGISCLQTPDPSATRDSPLPYIHWADPKEVWELMVRKDKLYPRDSEMLLRHPGIQAKMRAILLDWLIEVCEVYRLHRETYYLAQDFIDRYLTSQSNMPKQQLQLLGITSLFIAAKIEEIYPPKLTEFSYVTDGACTDSEILDKELVILKTLNWDLTPMTVNSWLNIFLQLASIKSQKLDGDKLLVAEFSSFAFVQIAQLIDLCMLDIGCLKFPYSVIAASALFHMYTEDISLSATGLKWSDIHECVQWMSPFALTIQENGTTNLQIFQQVTSDDLHNIQTHCVNLNLLEKAQTKQRQGDYIIYPPYLALTPPSSVKKVVKRICTS